MEPVVQLSLDLTSIDEALHVAEIGVRAGVDWLEAGTPLILAEGLHGVRALRERFPNRPMQCSMPQKEMSKRGLIITMSAMIACRHKPSVEMRPLRSARNCLAPMHFYGPLPSGGMRFDRAIG